MKGFTLIETLIVIAVLAIITTIGTLSFSNSKARKTVAIISNNIVFSLEEAKADAISGKGGVGHGIKFNSTSYVTFDGDTYNLSDTDNITHDLESGYSLDITTTDPDDSVVFSRITGDVNDEITITVGETNNPSNSKVISVGALGDINVVQ